MLEYVGSFRLRVIYRDSVCSKDGASSPVLKVVNAETGQFLRGVRRVFFDWAIDDHPAGRPRFIIEVEVEEAMLSGYGDVFKPGDVMVD